MIEAFLFDVGGVYLKGSFIDFMNRANGVLEINETFSASSEVVFDPDYNRGRVSVEECFRKLFGVPISDDQMAEIIALWTSTWKPEHGMVDLVQGLRKSYRLAVLSNSDSANSEVYRRKGWYDPFEHLILSHELGVLKPERRIYEIALERLQVPAESCVFIDDEPLCLEPADQMGMTTLQYRSTPQLKRELRKLGVRF